MQDELKSYRDGNRLTQTNQVQNAQGQTVLVERVIDRDIFPSTVELSVNGVTLRAISDSPGGIDGQGDVLTINGRVVPNGSALAYQLAQAVNGVFARNSPGGINFIEPEANNITATALSIEREARQGR